VYACNCSLSYSYLIHIINALWLIAHKLKAVRLHVSTDFTARLE
jgi:hypothetical protein